jgi:hypothetical protein
MRGPTQNACCDVSDHGHGRALNGAPQTMGRFDAGESDRRCAEGFLSVRCDDVTAVLVRPRSDVALSRVPSPQAPDRASAQPVAIKCHSAWHTGNDRGEGFANERLRLGNAAIATAWEPDRPPILVDRSIHVPLPAADPHVHLSHPPRSLAGIAKRSPKVSESGIGPLDRTSGRRGVHGETTIGQRLSRVSETQAVRDSRPYNEHHDLAFVTTVARPRIAAVLAGPSGLLTIGVH